MCVFILLIVSSSWCQWQSIIHLIIVENVTLMKYTCNLYVTKRSEQDKYYQTNFQLTAIASLVSSSNICR